jgi:thiol-disulfide isomerase/thioredoxin
VTPLLLAAALVAGQVDAAGLKHVVAAHKGRPVVVSLWATWCAPCIKEFPELARLARERPELAIVSVSIDDPSDQDVLEKFVGEQRPPFPVYMKAPGPDEPFINGVDPEWSGVVPALVIFDTRGKRTALLQGERTRAEIEKALEGIEK